MSHSEEVTERFDARSDEGIVYEVHKIQRFSHIKIISRKTTSPGIPGSIRYALSTGEHVNQRSEDQFEILWLDREHNEKISRI